MSTAEDLLAQLRAFTFVGTAQAEWIFFVFAQTHEARVNAVQKAIDFACNQLELNKHKKQEHDEDDLTVDICSMMNAAGFQASHDEQVNGHCDIVIKGAQEFLWLAEAKKHDAYAWLNKGFRQLATRYSTGVPGQDHGEVLVYCKIKDARALMENWRKELVARNPNVKVEPSSCGSPLIFQSTHKHDATGLDFHVRHKAVSLYWKPDDK